MLQADGVYSRYVIDLVAAKYSITFFIEGSIEGHKFSRYVRLGVVDVVGVSTSHDAIPPSRIVDLRSSLLSDTVNQVAFSWTAPGGDQDFGKADRYVVMTAMNQSELQEGGGTLLEGWPTPLEALAMQQHTMTWLHYDQVHYLVISAVDEEGNTGVVSNVINVYVPSPPPSTTVPSSSSISPITSVNTSASKEANSIPVLAALDTSQVAIILGCIGGIIVVIIIMICYCIAAKRRHRKNVAVKKAHEVQDEYNGPVTVDTKGGKFSDGKDGLNNGYMHTVESWSPSELLSSQNSSKHSSMSTRSDNASDHSDSTKKTYGVYSDQNDFYVERNQYHAPGYPDHYPQPSDDYPTPTESYTVTPTEGYSEGYPYPSEVRSYISSQPSDLFLSVSCDLPSSHGPPIYAAYPSYDASLRSTKVPPPIPPKPQVVYSQEPYLYDSQSLDPHASTPSVIYEQRIRNVTMV